MNTFLSPDGKAYRLIDKLVCSVWLNILWFLCCIPLITAGASTTALFYVSLKLVRNEEGNVTKNFFHSFKMNFRQGTKVWLILSVSGLLLLTDGYILYHMRYENVFWTILTAMFLVAVIGYFIIAMYVFPLLAHFDNTTSAMFKNALFIGMRFLLCTVLMAVIYFAMIYIIINIFTPAVIFGEGLCALLCSYLLDRILSLCEENNRSNNQDGDNEGNSNDSM